MADGTRQGIVGISMVHQRGFSLLEVLVAFSILALSLGVLLRIFSGAIANADTARDRERALVIAQSLLASASAEAPQTIGKRSGVYPDGFEWHIDVRPAGEEAVGRRIASPVVELWEIRVSVAWTNGLRHDKQTLMLATLRANGK